MRNVAAVMVTANLPPFANSGTRMDVDISSIGDASSLKGGTLLMTPLNGPDGQVYAVAQGPLAVSGFSAGGAAASITQGVPTTGRVPNGALIEREMGGSLDALKELVVELYNPDFSTATGITDTINAYTTATLRQGACPRARYAQRRVEAAGGYQRGALPRRNRRALRLCRYAGARRHR